MNDDRYADDIGGLLKAIMGPDATEGVQTHTFTYEPRLTWRARLRRWRLRRRGIDPDFPRSYTLTDI